MCHVATYAPLLYLSVRRGWFNSGIFLFQAAGSTSSPNLFCAIKAKPSLETSNFVLAWYPTQVQTSSLQSYGTWCQIVVGVHIPRRDSLQIQTVDLAIRGFRCSWRNRNLTTEKWKDKTLHLAANNERHTMINSPKESDFPLKQEGHSGDEKAKASSSSSAQWLRLKDPRIVRVSRAFGGKDRHSKVCTIRGLRDRRVRLSVPTAIQLYDLQARLGLNQPSKVVDWLLNAAKHEIDELPPLPNINPPGNFNLGFPSTMITSNEASTSQHNQQLFNNIHRSIQWEGSSQNSMWKPKSKDASQEMVTDKAKWMIKSTEEDKQGSKEVHGGAHVLANSLLPRANNPSFLGLLNTMPLGYHQWEPHSGDVAQLGNHGFTNQTDLQSINVVPFPSTLSLSTGNSQILVCPPGSTQSYFPSQVTASMDMDPRQINHYQMLSANSQNLLTTSSLNIPSFSLAMMSTPILLHSPNSRESPSHKDQDFPPK